MKKNLLFVLLLVSVTILLPAQTNTQELFVQDIEEFDIGFTDYDKQTNASQRNQMVTWEDGWVGACFIQATGVVAPDQTFPNRGTGYAYYDGTTWHPSAGRIEGERTGYGSVCRYGTNEVLICAHTGSNLVLYKSPRDGSNWQKLNVPTATFSNTTWPSVMTSGPNHNIIHVIVSNAPSSTPIALWYFRSTDGGATWSKDPISYLELPYANNGKLSANVANFMETTSPNHPVIPNRLAFIIADKWSDGQVIYSDDNGVTWNRKLYYQHPDPANYILTDGLFYPHAAAGAWDAQGKLHLTYEFAWGNDGQYRPYCGVAYWNETMPARDQDYYETLFNSHWPFMDAEPPMSPDFFGYLIPMDDELYFETGEILPDNVVDVWERGGTYFQSGMPHANYCNQSIVGLPSIAVNQSGTVYCVYACITEFTQSYWSEEHYYRLYARASTDNGQNWSGVEMLVKGEEHAEDECAFPWMSYKVLENGQNNLHVIYQQDDYPGTYVSNKHDPNGTKYRALRVKLDGAPPVPCNPVPNVTAVLNAAEVTVTWELPVDMVPVSYTIQRNGPTPKTVTVSAPATSYLDDVAAVQTGDYTYCVTPVYTSDICNLPAQQKCITESLHIIGIDPCQPVASIQKDYEEKEVTITWTAPATMIPLNYIVKRNGDVIHTTEDANVFSYMENTSEFEPGTYEYCVIPVYAEGSCIEGNDTKRCAEPLVLVGIKEMAKISFSIVPNPASSHITVTAANNFHTVEVLGFLGQTIYSQSNIGNKTTLDVSNYANGVYFVRVISENGVSVNKFVKQ